MAVTRKPTHRRTLLVATAGSAVAATAALLTPATPAAAAGATPGRQVAPGPQAVPGPRTVPPTVTVTEELDRIAHSLRSTEPDAPAGGLRALGAMIGDARVVGLGEATHGSHEFFTMKQRVFRYLVEEKGFTTFALEASWSAGLLIDAYVQGEAEGDGDARRLVRRTLAGSPWQRREFADLIEWMRAYNRSHPQRPVHFVGTDLGFPGIGEQPFAEVTAYVRKAAPASLSSVEQLYAGLRPFDDAIGYLTRVPLPQRQRNADLAQQALDLVTAAGKDGDAQYEWAVHHARNIARTFAFATMRADDASSVTAAQLLRDRAMADNTLWWQRRFGGKVLLSAHNGHIGYRSSAPALYPTTQGSHLRDALGAGYVSIGFTFGGGSFLTGTDPFVGNWQSTTVPPATLGMNEYLLDRVRPRDYYLDLRQAPPAARTWLDTAHPTYDAGTTFSRDPLPTLALGAGYDVLIHLHRVRAAERL
ncbi:erythromycin esterase family protein [Kitasatospora aureofaciens]|uniref:erythromycin esterase family protein n=1 Tax=Kitasatospora aureofaciens TaxID=1894 RepID=UPI001DD8AF92|nr:erythromycin esterase family protein [Kitasatospora aureofaciens]HJD82146.1 erythromycin esterase family protein [Kitasatospora aureofaciens]